MHPFRKFISNYVSIFQNDWEIIAARLEERVIQPQELILEEGKICRHLYFLESGFLRYFVWKDGNDVSKFFTNPPYCFTSQRSYNHQIPACENIEALEESVIWQIKKEDAEELMKLKYFC